MGMIPMENYQFGNRTYITNAIAYLNEPEELMTARDKEWVVRTLNKEKVSTNRLFWQILLTVVPLILLWLAYYTGLRIRKGQFAA
jgi:hypothetical protein